MIKCLLTELRRAGRENIWPSVMEHGPRCARSVCHDLGPNIFSSGPPTQSISTYYMQGSILMLTFFILMNFVSNIFLKVFFLKRHVQMSLTLQVQLLPVCW